MKVPSLSPISCYIAWPQLLANLAQMTCFNLNSPVRQEWCIKSVFLKPSIPNKMFGHNLH